MYEVIKGEGGWVNNLLNETHCRVQSWVLIYYSMIGGKRETPFSNTDEDTDSDS